MLYPQIGEIAASRDMLAEFQGYNHTQSLNDAEFYDMQNLTAAAYPTLSPRGRRGIIQTFRDPHALVCKNNLCWVDGDRFYYKGRDVGQVNTHDKQLVSMGAYILIFPDKKYYNTSTGEFASLGAKFTTVTDVSFTLTRRDGEALGNVTTGLEPPDEPKNKDYWIDTSDKPHVLKQFSAPSGMWVQVPTTYVKIVSTGIGKNFKQYDGVTISGCKDTQFNTDMVIWERTDDSITVTGIIDETILQKPADGAVTLERKVPDMAFVTECENRVWGCSQDGHEIYACKLGDPTNWRCYMGVGSDSYAATIGTDGFFTGACSHLGYVLFFKEDVIHKIYGSVPSNFQIKDLQCRGVQQGSEKSLVAVNEVLYYKSRDSVCAYDGGMPVSVSQAFGSVRYSGAVAGAIGDKYYISMCDAGGKYSLFVLDTGKGMWHREDDTQVKWFARYVEELYFVDGDNRLCTVNGTTSILDDAAPDPAKLEPPVQWYAETGDIGIDTPDFKYISKIQLRLSVARGAQFKVAISYDSSGEWETVASVRTAINRIFTFPFAVRRCGHMRLKFSGTGEFKLYSISKITEQGSEI